MVGEKKRPGKENGGNGEKGKEMREGERGREGERDGIKMKQTDKQE